MGVWEFLKSSGVSVYEVAKRAGIPRSSLYRIKEGHGVTFTVAWRLHEAFPEITFDGIARECGLLKEYPK